MTNTLIYAPGIITSSPVERVGDDVPPATALPGLPARWWCDLSDDSLRWEHGVFDLFGIARGQRLDRRAIVEMYAAPSRDLLDHLRSTAIATRGSFTFEAEIVRPDGAMRWMRVVADTVATNGRTTHLYGTKCDITHEMSAAVTVTATTA
ncbi:hypothetical protein ASE86_06915 [Sphingomonas sp. Leaf33]|uniref:hypothetical protein n=1 Tax=Sphingomonas sp. Leaf33 TaxID=1736215 RepID=UPI0007001786|nr:hypothetical protein [Sphingomonas sp. Leaf33]KQN25913.1 hypothetical protein ASE86_06915 [Sphingomonas sp. Leaf33]